MENEIECSLSVCRGCLESGRMYKINNNRLGELYTKLIREIVPPNDKLPPYICHMCRGLLLKYAEFRKMCQQSENILLNIEKNNLTSNPHRYKISETYTTNYPELNIVEVLIETTHIEDAKIKSEDEVLIKSTDTDNLDDVLEIDTNTSKLTSKDKDKRDRKKRVVKKIKSTYFENSKIKSEDKLLINRTNSNGIDNTLENLLEMGTNDTINNSYGRKRVVKKDVNNKPGKPYKRVKHLDKINGKSFETKENVAMFETLFDVDVVILSKEQQMKDILDRKSSYNYQNGLFKCQDCFKGFIDENSYSKHYRTQHDPSQGSIVCEFCKFRYKDKRGLNQHLKRHRLKFVCRQCNYVSRTVFNAKEHFKMHSGQMHKCKDCGKSYEKLSAYLSHLRIHHPEELVWCELCGEPFIGDFGLNGHKKKAHRDLKYPAECACAKCGVRFTNAAAYETHSSLSCDKLASCCQCGRVFDTQTMLREHILENHRVVKRNQCIKCDKIFGSESQYSAHYRRMHVASTKRSYTEQPCVCEVCGKTLPNKSRLVYHQRNHTGEKPYKCSECNKGFTMKKLLKSHSRVHSDERPFACKFCPKTFKGPSALRIHENVHTGGEKMKKVRNIT